MSGASTWQTEAFPDTHNSPFRVHDGSHNIGGAVTGKDPATSVLNRYQQHRGAYYLFVPGASSYPNNGDHNPIITFSVLTLWMAHAIVN